MGKQKRIRKKLHIPAEKNTKNNFMNEELNKYDSLPLPQVSKNLFEGLNINFDSLNKKLPDDIASVKSFKSLKSELGTNNALSKKEKLKLRRQLLLQRIDTVNQMKKANSSKKKQKNSVTNNVDILHDALPSLKSLLKDKSESGKNNKQPAKPKGIEKQSKRKKNLIQNIQIYKQLFKNKLLEQNLTIISEHVKVVSKQNTNHCKY